MNEPKSPVLAQGGCLIYREGVRCNREESHRGDHRYPPQEPQGACKHCGRSVANHHHLEGRQRGLMRCDSLDSGLPYGYNAETPDQPCTIACLGFAGEVGVDDTREPVKRPSRHRLEATKTATRNESFKS